MSSAVVVKTGKSFRSTVEAGNHQFIADEPAGVGGGDEGPNPYDFLAAALGTCKTMTMRMYADRKKWPLDSVEAVVSHGREHSKDCEDCLTAEGYIHRFVVTITLHGNLSEEQRQRIFEIAGRCPVAKTLSHEIRIIDELK